MCRCGQSFVDPEAYRDRLPCPGDAETQEAEAEAVHLKEEVGRLRAELGEARALVVSANAERRARADGSRQRALGHVLEVPQDISPDCVKAWTDGWTATDDHLVRIALGFEVERLRASLQAIRARVREVAGRPDDYPIDQCFTDLSLARALFKRVAEFKPAGEWEDLEEGRLRVYLNDSEGNPCVSAVADADGTQVCVCDRPFSPEQARELGAAVLCAAGPAGVPPFPKE